MINLNNLIIDYINKLTVNDLLKYAKKKDISISYSDALIVYQYIKNNYHDFLSGNDSSLIKEIKNKIDSNTFKDIYKLYLEYKIKYLK